MVFPRLRPALRARLRAVAATVALALALCFPAALNGSPFLFWDSDAYYSAGRSVFANLPFGADNAPSAPTPTPNEEPAVQETTGDNLSLTLWSARSPYYGAVLYAGTRTAGLWGIVLFQALLAATVLWRVVNAFTSSPLRLYIVLGAVVVLATSVPWFASFVMPGVSVGVTLLLMLTFVCAPRRPSDVDVLFLAGLCSVAAVFHRANIPLIATAALGCGLLAWFRVVDRKRAFRMAAASGAGLLIAFLAGIALNAAVEQRTGERLRTPIFVTARVLADGPGRAYLASACEQDSARFVLCRFRNLPLDDSNDILWSADPGLGVYTASDYATRVALSEEQWRFVWGAVLHDPVAQFDASLTNTWRQLGMSNLAEFRQNLWVHWSNDPWWSNQAILEHLPHARACLRTPSLCPSTPAAHFFDPVQRLAALAGSLLLLWAAWRLKPWRSDTQAQDRELAVMAGLVLLLLLVNAAVCGALSEPSPRYQTRVQWLAPVVAALIVSLRWAALTPKLRFAPASLGFRGSPPGTLATPPEPRSRPG